MFDGFDKPVAIIIKMLQTEGRLNKIFLCQKFTPELCNQICNSRLNLKYYTALYQLPDNQYTVQTSVAYCCNPPILIGPSSAAYKLQPPTHRSLVGQTIPHVRPRGLSEKMAFEAP